MDSDDLAFKTFIDTLNKLTKIAEEMPADVTEADTEAFLVEPYFESLGYNMRDWRHVRKQYGTEQWGTERVDYALIGNNDEPLCLVECKKLSLKLNKEDRRQLRRYYNDTPAKVGILTNGQSYEIYLDSVKDNVMDEEPFFTFAIGDRDMVAQRAAAGLARLEGGAFDMEVFKKAVDTWRFTSTYKPAAMRLFKGWLTQQDDELVRLLQNRLGAPEGSLDGLTHVWFAEFVGEIPPPPPPGNIRPLTAWNIRRKRDMPNRIIFPDGTSHSIAPAKDVPVETTKWLIQNGHLTLDSLPIRFAERYIVSETAIHPTEKPMIDGEEAAEWAYVEGNYSPQNHVRNAKIIIEHVGQDPEEFKGQFPDIVARQP